MKTKTFMLASALLCGFVLLGGCASIPPESAELSSELGKQIDQIEAANLTLLSSYFDMKREQVDLLMEQQWIPLFSKNYFQQPEVEAIWEAVVESSNDRDRVEFLIRTGPVLQKQINTKRMEMIRPLDELERSIEKKIREQYTQVRLMNNTITGFLMSASEVAELRTHYLEMAGVSDQKVAAIIEQLNETVSGLAEKADTAEDLADKSSRYLEKINKLKDSL